MLARHSSGGGAHQARGILGSAALATESDRVVRETGIRSPVETRRGWPARLHYLDSPAGRDTQLRTRNMIGSGALTKRLERGGALTQGWGTSARWEHKRPASACGSGLRG